MTNEEKTKKNVETVSDMLNVFGFNTEDFCKLFQREHRTIQQCFTRLCVEWLRTCASDDYCYDGRNEASHEVAKRLLESIGEDDICLPFI